MKIGYLVFNLDGMGGTSRSAVTQANALAGDHDVTLLSVTRSGERPHYEIDDRIRVRYLVDVREGQDPSVPGVELPASQARALHERESLLVPERWDGQFTALCDVGLEHVLPGVKLDVLVTVTPGLLAAAIQLLPPEPVVVHQEHRSTSDRSSGLDPLLNFAPRADVVAVFTPAMADWVREQLGDSTPEIAIVPNPLPLGFTPRSRLDNPLVMTAGRLVNEKQFPRLIEAFAQVSDQLPEWRLRIYGTGPKRQELLRHVRKLGMFDRVELPGAVADMRGEWAKASICALTSRAEGFPLVGPGGDGGRRTRRQLRLRVRTARDHRARGQRTARLARVDRGHGVRAAAAGHRRRPASRARRGRLPDLAPVRRVRHRRALGRHLQRRADPPYRRRSADPPRHRAGRRQAGADGGGRRRRGRPGSRRPRRARRRSAGRSGRRPRAATTGW